MIILTIREVSTPIDEAVVAYVESLFEKP